MKWARTFAPVAFRNWRYFFHASLEHYRRLQLFLDDWAVQFGQADRMSPINLPFLLHAIVEAPAFVNFLLFPSGQLGTTTLHAHPVVRQYALLILSSILIASVFISRVNDELSGQIGGSLALYHVGPSIRALSRLHRRAELSKPLFLSEASFHLFVHSICCGSLLQCCWSSYLSARLTHY